MLARALIVVSLLGAVAVAPAARAASFVEFESGQVRPLALSPDGTHLFAVDTPDNRLEIFDVAADGTLVPRTPAAYSTHTVPGAHEPRGVGCEPSRGRRQHRRSVRQPAAGQTDPAGR